MVQGLGIKMSPFFLRGALQVWQIVDAWRWTNVWGFSVLCCCVNHKTHADYKKVQNLWKPQFNVHTAKKLKIFLEFSIQEYQMSHKGAQILSNWLEFKHDLNFPPLFWGVYCLQTIFQLVTRQKAARNSKINLKIAHIVQFGTFF